MKKLCTFMQKAGINFYDYKIGMSKAVTIEVDKQFGIFIDTSAIESQQEEYCAIAHEGGHCATGATHKLSSSLDLIEKHEYKADKWAVHKIVPIKELKKAVKRGYKEIWDLADFFNVTEDFIKRAIYIYQCEGLL